MILSFLGLPERDLFSLYVGVYIMISNFKICQRVFLQVKIPSFPNRARLVDGHFGQNGQKLHENYKPNAFGAKQWINMWGKANILGRTDPPVSCLCKARLLSHFTFTKNLLLVYCITYSTFNIAMTMLIFNSSKLHTYRIFYGILDTQVSCKKRVMVDAVTHSENQTSCKRNCYHSETEGTETEDIGRIYMIYIHFLTYNILRIIIV